LDSGKPDKGRQAMSKRLLQETVGAIEAINAARDEERRRFLALVRHEDKRLAQGYAWDPVALEEAIESGYWPEGMER
jgi:hypothetical protein